MDHFTPETRVLKISDQELNSYNAILLGCGRIAGGYDKPGDGTVLTHAHALTRAANFKLAGVYDVQADAAEAMAKKWGSKAFHSLPEIFEQTKPEVAVICVPDNFHEQMLESVLAFQPRIVICEKPLGKNLANLSDILSRYRARNISLAVNFNRNFDRSVVQLKQDLSSGKYGTFLNGVFYYSKGFRHNGSHAVSLLRYLFGEIATFDILDSRIDYHQDDPTLDLRLTFTSGAKCYMLGGDERAFSIFEWSFIFANARLVFIHDGFKLQRQDVTDDPLFPGYKTLGQPTIEETGLKDSVTLLYKNVLNHMERKEPLNCNGDDALITQTIIEKILEHSNLK